MNLKRTLLSTKKWKTPVWLKNIDNCLFYSKNLIQVEKSKNSPGKSYDCMGFFYSRFFHLNHRILQLVHAKKVSAHSHICLSDNFSGGPKKFRFLFSSFFMIYNSNLERIQSSLYENRNLGNRVIGSPRIILCCGSLRPQHNHRSRNCLGLSET